MLGSIRKFSSTIYAKILLGVIIIPFVFWGMGNTFFGGSKNIVVVIDKEKYSVQELTNFINRTAVEKVKATDIDRFLSAFIGEKLMEKEIELLGINLSDSSLSKLIKHQKGFKRNNKFSRTEYEKFLLENNLTAITFESMLSAQEKKKQMLNFISGGIFPTKFLINMTYDKINQKRNIELINLNNAFNKKLNFSENTIATYFENNKNKYSDVYRTIKLLELNPKKLVGDDEFTDLFFKKIDEIDDLIISGRELNQITEKFNLENPNLHTINKLGKSINPETNQEISKDLIEKIFNIDEIEPTVLIESNNKYFIIELLKSENIKKSIEDELIRSEIILDLKNKTKRKLAIQIIDKINKKNFSKSDFDKFSREENVNIQKISLKNQNDYSVLKREIVNQIYTFSEKKVILVNDLNFSESYLIYIDEIENVKISDSSEEYQKYLNISKAKIVGDLYNTYDSYIQKRYKIDINYQALDIVKNYFN